MSLLILAIEYMLLHTVFESIRNNDEKEINNKSLRTKLNNELLSKWNPLSNEEWKSIRTLTIFTY